MKKKLGSLLAILLCGALVGGNLTFAADRKKSMERINQSAAELELFQPDDYDLFLESYAKVQIGKEETVFSLDEDESYGFSRVSGNAEGMSSGYYTNGDSQTVWTGEIEEAGLYTVRLDYIAETQRGSTMIRDILINGKKQHSGCQGLEFPRIYVDHPDEIGKRDTNGNEIKPTQMEIQKLQTAYAKNAQGLYNDPYLYYFEKGTNTITLTGISEPMTIGGIYASPLETLPSYKEYGASVGERNGGEGQETIWIEAENASFKSTPVLYGKYDRVSPVTSPAGKDGQNLNMIGGSNWSKAGQYLVWEFEVAESGYYNLSLKARQNFNRDFKTSRAIYLDGKIPFEEWKAWEFSYDPKWQIITPGDESGNYRLWLEKGKHEIKLEASLGVVAEQTKKVQNILLQLNKLYTDIMIITGSTPDKMRDYRLGTLMPDLTGEMLRLADELQEVLDWMTAYSSRGQNFAALEVSIKQLRKMGKDADSIPKQLNFFKSNNGALANWMIKSREQPLELDYIAFVPEGGDALPSPNAGFFQQLGFSVSNFLKSFSGDYQTMGSMEDVEKTGDNITVWIPTGRDQAQVLRKLIDQTFTPRTGITVNLQLVTAASLLPATVAGNGPDVALSMGDTEPVNYAIRDAVIDLNRFPDFEEVEKRFLPERMVPLTFEDKVYALPETQNFNVMFYRTDILEELGIEVPQTWTEVIATIPLLLKRNMSFALPVSVPRADLIEAGTSAFYTMLLQNGGQIYKDGGAAADFDSEKGMEAFNQWTNLYVNYGLPQEYDFLTRFRSGESPIIVGNFANFNTLMVSAPEIKGLWSFTLVPGTVREDGSIDRSTPLSGVDCFIMKNSDNYEDSWEFLKWWTDAQTQVDFGKEMESILGESARYSTANVEGFSQIAWDNEFYEVLTEQMKWGRGIPQVPGGYFTGRHINNAFRKVVVSKEDMRETLLDYVYVINQELLGKRKEFGLSVPNQY